VRCDLIETHTTGKGGDGDDAAIIEELHKKVLKQFDEIERLMAEKQALADNISKNYLGDLLRAINIMQKGLTEKKSKIENIENGLNLIQNVLGKMEAQEL
jgi:predicted RNase H-like nuclease (RuvC/YqgF family)